MAMTYHLDGRQRRATNFSGLVEKIQERVAKVNWQFTLATHRCSPPLSLV